MRKRILIRACVSQRPGLSHCSLSWDVNILHFSAYNHDDAPCGPRTDWRPAAKIICNLKPPLYKQPANDEVYKYDG